MIGHSSRRRRGFGARGQRWRDRCRGVTGCVSGLHGSTVMRTRAKRASAMCLARMSSETADGHHAEAGATEDKTEAIDIHDCFTTPMRGALGGAAPSL